MDRVSPETPWTNSLLTSFLVSIIRTPFYASRIHSCLVTTIVLTDIEPGNFNHLVEVTLYPESFPPGQVQFVLIQ